MIKFFLGRFDNTTCSILGLMSNVNCINNVTNTLKDKALGDGGKSLAQGIT